MSPIFIQSYQMCQPWYPHQCHWCKQHFGRQLHWHRQQIHFPQHQWCDRDIQEWGYHQVCIYLFNFSLTNSSELNSIGKLIFPIKKVFRYHHTVLNIQTKLKWKQWTNIVMWWIKIQCVCLFYINFYLQHFALRLYYFWSISLLYIEVIHIWFRFLEFYSSIFVTTTKIIVFSACNYPSSTFFSDNITISFLNQWALKTKYCKIAFMIYKSTYHEKKTNDFRQF